jgi:hypothetical protein
MTTTNAIDAGREEQHIRLNDCVLVRRRFLRSVNLERDFYAPNSLEGYVLTPASLSTLKRLSEGIKTPSARAWSLTGAYGSGKSAFALMATKALAVAPVGDAGLRTRLQQQEPGLSAHLFTDDQGYWPVLVTGGREPIVRALLRGLHGAMKHLPASTSRHLRDVIVNTLAPHMESGSQTGRDVVAVIEALSDLVRQAVPNCAGLMIVVDEMGKFLEYAALHPEQGDMQVLQDIAEAAARSVKNPILFVTILHQAFEEYGHRLSSSQRMEWQKVQGRFSDVPFGDSPEETFRMLGQALEQTADPNIDIWLENTLEQGMAACRNLRIIPALVSAAEFRDLLRQIYPLHPLTGLVLPHLFRRFGQNERTLFSFLSSEEPHGMQEFLRQHTLSSHEAPLLRLDHLYDYIVSALGASLYSHSTAKLWSETEETLNRLRDKPPLQGRLIKTIGLLSAIGDHAHVAPSRQALIFALEGEGITAQQIEATIEDLASQTLITYRHFKKAYRLFEGSDIDIESRLQEAHAHLSRNADSVKMAHLLSATPPIVARRHSYETGTLRYFEVRCCRPNDLASEIQIGYADADGLLLLCLAQDASELPLVQESAQYTLADQPEIIVGVNVETPALHEAATQVESLLWVQEHTPELRNDRVATREVSERLSDAMTAFRTEWERLLRPQNITDDGSLWLHHGERVSLSSYRQLQSLVSAACSEAYPHTPHLRNELINRRQISSTAASARRVLIENMIEHRAEYKLGITGYPPEASMYVSLLESTGIHRQADSGAYDFLAPPVDRDPALRQVWNEIEGFLFGGVLEARPLTALNARLQSRPYGLANGVIPVLLCAVLLHHQSEVVVYEEGRFVTELDTATFERLIKRPENFSLQGCRVDGERRVVLDRFAKGVLRPGMEITLVNVVRELYRQFSRFPEYTLKTRTLSQEAQELRSVFKDGKQPEQLLFSQIPLVLGVRPLRADESDTANVESLFSRWNETMSAIVGAYEALLNRLEKVLCEHLSMTDWIEMKLRSTAIRPFVTEQRLRAFVMRASDENLNRQKWLESVAASVVGRPPYTWSDAEESHFVNHLPPLCSAFKHSELLWFAREEKSADEDHVGVRLTITQETGSEQASVAVVPKAERKNIQELTQRLLSMFEEVMKEKSQDLRVAVISQLAQEVLNGNDHK